jgi:two-component system, NtrC family, C4-dicarboxylate transport sensor histidine kinase DctB
LTNTKNMPGYCLPPWHESPLTKPAPHPQRPRWRSLALLALLLTPLLWTLQRLAERYYSGVLAEQNRKTLDLYVANLLGTLRRPSA